MNATEVMITWRDVSSDESGFMVERRTGNGAWRAVITTAANATSWRDSGLTAQTGYDYRVTALRPGGVAVATATVGLTLPGTAVQTIFYVDALSGQNSNPGTEARPWQTIQKAADTLQPGQTVLVRNGTYTSSNYTIVQINKPGAPNAWITYRNFPGERPRLKSDKRYNYNSFEIRSPSTTVAAAYLVIDGFEMEGHLNDLTVAEADASFQKFSTGAIRFEAPDMSSSGVSVDGRDKTKPAPHHIIFRNNYIHDHPLGGAGGMGADYITIENNRIANVGRYSAYGGSGISFLGPRNTDNNTADYKLVIRGNTVSDAINDYACACYSFRQPTDGNGIILDTMDSGDFKGVFDTADIGYKGRTLVVNNMVFNNGGRGIHVFGSSNVDVFFNTAVRNSTKQITGEGELTVVRSAKVRAYNNVLVARTDRPAYSISFRDAASKSANAASVDVNFNLIFGGTTPALETSTIGVIRGNNLVGFDPKFISETGSAAFTLQPASPAVNPSWATGISPPANDVYLAPRPRGASADAGAVESN